MIRQTLSAGSSDHQNLRELSRPKRESNTSWLQRAYADFTIRNKNQWSFIVLAGGKDIAAFRIRVAQSHLRSDMLPSYWSDCALLKVISSDLTDASIFNLPLLQPSTASYAPARNGLVELPLSKIPNQKDFPNLALLAIPVTQNDIHAALDTYKKSRVAYDAVENILPWLAFVWGAGSATNPLMQQIGFPSAVMLNQLFSAQGFDLAPGINRNLSTPEAFWSGIKHWQDYYSKTQQNGLLPQARYVIDHRYDIDEG